MPARDVLARVGRALMGLPAPRRLRLDLVPTPDGIRVTPCRLEPVQEAMALVADTDSAPVLALPPPDSCLASGAQARYGLATSGAQARYGEVDAAGVPRMADVDADDREATWQRWLARRALAPPLETRPPADHAMALLHRLQSEPATVGRVDLDVIDGVWRDMLIELGWAERSWAQVSCELSKLIGATRKSYRNGRAGEPAKVRVFFIPDPAEAELAETWDDTGLVEYREAA